MALSNFVFPVASWNSPKLLLLCSTCVPPTILTQRQFCYSIVAATYWFDRQFFTSKELNKSRRISIRFTDLHLNGAYAKII